MVLLDTDHVSLLQLNTGAAASRLVARLSSVPSDQVATTIVTYEEQTRGWLAYLAWAKTIAQEVEAYRRLQRLRRSRIRIGTMDLKIAAIALSRDELLITRNREDFEKVPGFSFEDWTV